MDICYTNNCKNPADFTCSCNPSLFICSQHVLSHQDLGFHSLQLLYSKLDRSVQSKAIKILKSTLTNLNEAIKIAKARAEELITQINSSLATSLTGLYGQKEFYETMLKECKNSRGISRKNYKDMWRVLNTLGSKDLWKITEFDSALQVNPMLLAIQNILKEFSQPITEDFTKKTVKTAYSDFNYREILDFLCNLEVKGMQVAITNAKTLAERLKKTEFIEIRNKPAKIFKPNFQKFAGLGILFNPQANLKPNLTINPLITNFLETELTKTVLKTAKNFKSLQPLLPNYIDLPYISIPEFFSTIKITFSLTNQELLKTLLDKYDFNQHCSLIKQFFLFGQGDFFHLLFEELFIYKRIKDLDTLLEESYWKTNAKYVPEKIFKVLSLRQDEDFIMLEWESFRFDMEVKYPLSLLLPKDVIKELQRVFSFIWQVRRVDFLLKQNSYKRKILGFKVPQDLKILLHQLNIFRFKLTRFINASLFFFLEEVIETAWKQFLSLISLAEDLEDFDMALKDLVKHIQLYNFLNAKTLYKKFFDILRLIIKFVDLQQEIENSIAIDSEPSDNDYSDSYELLQDLQSTFTTDLNHLKSELICSNNQLFYYFQITLNEL